MLLNLRPAPGAEAGSSAVEGGEKPKPLEESTILADKEEKRRRREERRKREEKKRERKELKRLLRLQHGSASGDDRRLTNKNGSDDGYDALRGSSTVMVPLAVPERSKIQVPDPISRWLPATRELGKGARGMMRLIMTVPVEWTQLPQMFMGGVFADASPWTAPQQALAILSNVEPPLETLPHRWPVLT
ncbi:hypothetical protein JB92DRAFT_3101543 [Gautieria morchelliformis]|nr:hypothetical protein JB92DRAFT_3101543 [Gautieria morchelliformis]